MSLRFNEVTVDLFLFVSTFHQRLDQGGLPDMNALYAEAKLILKRMEKKVAGDHVLQAKYDKAKYGLVGLVDEVVMTSNADFSGNWPVLEQELFGSQIAGDQVFEDISQLTADDQDLFETFFYVLTLGFRGTYHSEGQKWEETILKLYHYLPGRMLDESFRLTPDAYRVLERKIHKLNPVFSLGRYLIVSLGIVFLSILLYWAAWTSNISEIRETSESALNQMQNKALQQSFREDKK